MLGALLCALLGALAISAPSAFAYRGPLSHEDASHSKVEEEWLLTSRASKAPPPDGQVEGACGVAVSPLSGALYVADFYHRVIDVFSPAGEALGGTIALAGGDPRLEVNVLNAVCGLAVDPSGKLYANELHDRVMVLPGEQVVDSGKSTGVAVDQGGNVYVDDRTYVAKYEAPVVPGEAPVAKIGLGSLGDAYGVAVDASGGRVYVPDAADDTVKLFEPAVELAEPTATIAGPPESHFSSLLDASVAVDASGGEGQGNLLVTDNLKPGSESPEAAIYEFGASGEFLDRLQSRTYGLGGKAHGPIFGEPSGIAIDPASGELYVTTGNSEDANVLKYGPREPFAPPAPPSGSGPVAGPAADPPGEQAGPLLFARSGPPAGPPASSSVVVRRGSVQVSFDGKLTPHALPRHGTAPVGIAVDARITGTGEGAPPQLRRIAIAINRNGRLSATGLPICRERQIQPSTTESARATCGGALVGEGRFAANVKLPEQSPFPSSGKVLAFNGRLHGRPAILAHIYGTEPAPTSYVLPFAIEGAHGTYGTVLEASLPQATGDWGYVTGLKMTLRRSFRFHGKRHSYLSAGCPAPSGFPSAVFPLARTSFAFAGGMTLTSVLNRSCRAKG
jgi:DNA-binding beta-propeller fold protein YncE